MSRLPPAHEPINRCVLEAWGPPLCMREGLLLLPNQRERAIEFDLDHGGIRIHRILGEINDEDAGLIGPECFHELTMLQFATTDDADTLNGIADSLHVYPVRGMVVTDQVERGAIFAQQAGAIIVILGNASAGAIKRFSMLVGPASEAEEDFSLFWRDAAIASGTHVEQ